MNFKQSLLSGKLAERVNEAIVGEVLDSSTLVFNVMTPLISQHEGVECFYTIFLNAKNKVIQIKKMFNGTLTSCAVYPKEIIKEAINCNASAIILVHNHPSGDTNPSECDKLITKRIGIACTVMGIQLYDHIIIGNESYSMTAEGDMNQINNEIKELDI